MSGCQGSVLLYGGGVVRGLTQGSLGPPLLLPQRGDTACFVRAAQGDGLSQLPQGWRGPCEC